MNIYRSNALNLPQEEHTANREKLPYVFCRFLSFSRAHRIIENVFGILAALFRIFQAPVNLQIHNIETIVMNCCVLYNFLRRNCGESYISSDLLENSVSNNLLNLQHGHNRSVSNDAKLARNAFLRYFNNEGAVEWQNN
ncbi:hypothetical protein NQ318_002674 [Aromia moschata]|uniref:DDE Tnp4 domain-containing protein n=1 Tax=Aromia moschata TaxID=1265417 RepID=A0AAV8XVG0_9CUCU|nr:hypothetical protein NQ318_002674 [Aromia moschata]